MARRRTRGQINADKIIKKELNILGEKIYNQAVLTSRRDTGVLQDTQNFRVKPDTVLTMAQVHYGQYNFPKGKNGGEKNALLIAVKDNIPESTKIIVAEITDELLKNFK